MAVRTVRLRERETYLAGDVDLDIADLRAIKGVNSKVVSRSLDEQDRLEVTTGGFVGHLPISADLDLVFESKVPIANLFGMMELVSGLKLDDKTRSTFDSGDLEEVFGKLATSLARRVLQRCRHGLYKAYVPVTEDLPHVRGRMNVIRLATHPQRLDLECCFENHTEDIDENRIVAWTLRRMSGMPFREDVLCTVRRAISSLRGSVEISHAPPSACLGRIYNRLNEPYRILHQLCWFFLANSGPVFSRGERRMTSFLLNIDALFESYVAEWLRRRLLASGFRASKKFPFAVEHMNFEIDVLVHGPDGHPWAVLDTKYKDVDKPANADVNQVVTYAHAEGCSEAVLIYPSLVTRPLIDARFGSVRVRSLTYDLSNPDLDAAGESFVAQLFSGSSLFDELTFRTG